MRAPPEGQETPGEPDAQAAASEQSAVSAPDPSTPDDAERAPGWYPDPEDARWRRYWDGQAWTSASPDQLEAEPVHDDPGATITDERARSPYLARALVILVVVAAVIAVLIGTNSGGHSQPASGTASATSSTATPGAANVQPTTVTASTSRATTLRATPVSRPPVSVARVTRVLDAYAAAYNARSIVALKAILSPALFRRAGDSPPQGLSGALVLYAAQFAGELYPDFALAAISVTPGLGQAGAKARFGVYAHGARARGQIAFHLALVGRRLLIDRILVSDD